MKVKDLPMRFHLHVHTTGFCQQTRKLEPPYKTPAITQGVKGLLSSCVSKKFISPNPEEPQGPSQQIKRNVKINT